MSEEWKKEFIDTLSKKFEVDMKRYEISDYIWKSLFNMERERNTYKATIDKANRVLGETLIKYEDGVFKPIKNTSKQDVYKAVCKLYGILGTTAREGYKDE